LDESAFLGHQLGGRAAGEGAELAGEVGLVVVAGAGGEAGQVEGPAGRGGGQEVAPGVVEAGDPGQFLGGEPDVAAERGEQAAWTPADVAGQGGGARPSPGTGDEVAGAGVVCRPPTRAS